MQETPDTVERIVLIAQGTLDLRELNSFWAKYLMRRIA